jgi:hypothetical protein
LVIKKSVEGSMGDKEKKFDFNLNLELAAGTEVQGTIARTDKSTETITFKKGDNKFQLADGDVLTVADIPTGTLYTVTESGADDYATDIVCETKDNKVVANNTKEYSASDKKTPISDGGNTISFTNTKDYAAPTGIRLDIMPYLTLFALAGAGAIIFFAGRLRKR